MSAGWMRLRGRSCAHGAVILPCSGAPISSGNAAQQPEHSGPFVGGGLPFSAAPGAAMEAMDSASGRFVSGELMSVSASMMNEPPERASTMALPLHSTQVRCAAAGIVDSADLRASKPVPAWLPLLLPMAGLMRTFIAPSLTCCIPVQIVLAPRAASVPEVPMLPAHLAGGHPSLVRRAAGVKSIGRSAGARSSGLEVTTHLMNWSACA